MIGLLAVTVDHTYAIGGACYLAGLLTCMCIREERSRREDERERARQERARRRIEEFNQRMLDL